MPTPNGVTEFQNL